MSNTPCSCPVAGFCSRHGIAKSEHYFRLCQEREDYRAKWDANQGPMQRNPSVQKQRNNAHQERLEQARKHWAELHQKKNANAIWLADWQKRIPKYGCACGENFKRVLRTNPPRFDDDWFRWTVAVHNAVNRKLGKPEIEYEKACELWQSE